MDKWFIPGCFRYFGADDPDCGNCKEYLHYWFEGVPEQNYLGFSSSLL